jgi:hypothetical protein
MSEQDVEKEIQEKELTAPRVRPEDLDAEIEDEQYHVFQGTTMTVCCLTLRNGFQVTGFSAAASPQNFDEEIGRTIAKRNAREAIWGLLGFRLRDQLHEGSMVLEERG